MPGPFLQASPQQRFRASARRYLSAAWPYFLIAAIIAFRNPLPLTRAEFWAEDGSQFFGDALNLGVKGVITPFFGYHFFLCRVIAYLATFFPVVYAPLIYNGSSWLLNA